MHEPSLGGNPKKRQEGDIAILGNESDPNFGNCSARLHGGRRRRGSAKAWS